MSSNFGVPIGNPNAGLAILFPVALRRHEGVVRSAHRGDGSAERFGYWSSGEAVQFGLGIKQIDMTRAALHEKPDHGFRLGDEVWPFRGRRLASPREHPIQCQEVRKSQRAEAATSLHQKFATGCDWNDVGHINCNTQIRSN